MASKYPKKRITADLVERARTDPDARRELMMFAIPIGRWIWNKFLRRRKRQIDEGDVIAMTAVALADVPRTWSATGGLNAASYAFNGAILHCTRQYALNWAAPMSVPSWQALRRAPRRTGGCLGYGFGSSLSHSFDPWRRVQCRLDAQRIMAQFGDARTQALAWSELGREYGPGGKAMWDGARHTDLARELGVSRQRIGQLAERIRPRTRALAERIRKEYTCT